MIHRCHRALFLATFGTLLLLAPSSLRAQAEHVEATHPVYDFLNRLQIRGVVEGYSRASLPLELKQVRSLLEQASRPTNELTAVEHSILERYLSEFVSETDLTRPLRVAVGASLDDVQSNVFSNEPNYFYAWRSGEGSSTFFMELLASLDYRTLLSAEAKSNVTLAQAGGRFRGTLGGLVGFSLTATNGTLYGNRSLALSDPRLSRNFNFGQLNKEYFDLTEAVVSMTWDWGSASAGKEKRLSGTGRSNLALLSYNAQPFDAVQFEAHFGVFRFNYLHGALLSEARREPNGKPLYDAKYLALHRVEADILDAVRFGVFEAVIYSGRALDLAYVNPVNFYKSDEHAGGDRDNPMLGFEFSSLGLNGLELYGSWLIDDLDFSLLGKSWWGNKFILQAGMIATGLLPNTDITVEYSRIDPYVYSHRFLGNQYTHNGAALGFELAPNSDEIYIAFLHWIGSALRLGMAMHHRRHGKNELDSEGNVLVNHGADIYESLGYERDSETAPFLAGIREDSTLLTFTAVYEPWRDMFLSANYWFQIRREAIGDAGKSHFLSLMFDVRI